MTRSATPQPWRRESAGRYLSADGRFAIDTGGPGYWYVTDDVERDELGLPRRVGPFGTLEEAKAAAEARREQAPEVSPLRERIAEARRRPASRAAKERPASVKARQAEPSLTPAQTVEIRPQTELDADAVRDVIARAFDKEPQVVPLEEALARRPDSSGHVAVLEGRVVGQVRLTRGWIDAEPGAVEVLVLGPLSVAPDVQRRGIGRALVAHALAAAEAAGAPAVFLEGDPAYYGRLGWRPAADIGVRPPSARIPAGAFQVTRLRTFEPWMRGQLIYADTFWAYDCVGPPR